MTAGKDSITVVVSALNEEKHLEGAVTTLLEAVRHWFDEYEILVFNDGSTDRTGEVAEQLAQRDEHVRAIHHDSPSCIGGVIRKGFAQAEKHYVIWVDGKGATTREALDVIFSHRGEADIVVPFPNNQHQRSPARRAVSWTFQRFLLNTLFGTDLMYFTHCNLYTTAQVQRVKVKTNSYAHQAELVIKLIKSGCSYVQVPVQDRYDFTGRRTKAFKPGNVFGIARFLASTIWDVYLSGEYRAAKKTRTVNVTAAEAAPAEMTPATTREE